MKDTLIKNFNRFQQFCNYKKLASSILFVCIAVCSQAHEFWLSPNKYWYSPYENGYLSFNVGESFTGENWTGNNEKVQQLMHYLPDGRALNIEHSVSDKKGDSIQLKELREGTQMIIFHSKNSFIKLDANKFAEYLKEDGLLETLAYRKAHGEDSLPGKEFYQRSVKAIFQVGDFKNDVCTKPTTLPLDIVPKSNIYGAVGKKNAKITLTIYFKGEPLIDAKLKLWHKSPTDSTTMVEFTTDKKGRIETSIDLKGTWMASCVHMVRTANNAEADWQSYWGSMTWGYEKEQ